MASAFYQSALRSFLKGEIDLISDTVKLAYVDTDTYTVDLENHDFYDDVTGVQGTPEALTSKTVTGSGNFDAADTLDGALSGTEFEAAILYVDTGTPATSRLICFLDDATGFPFTPSGGPANAIWSSSGIFTLG